MSDARDLEATDVTGPGPRPDAPAPPRAEYLRALERYEGIRLVEIHQALELDEPAARPRLLASQIADRLGEPRVVSRVLGALEHDAREALGLFALTESPAWSLAGLAHALGCLGIRPSPTIDRLLGLGLLAAETAEGGAVGDVARRIEAGRLGGVRILAHPGVVSGARTVLPAPPLTPHEGKPRRERETDGLEPVLRLAAVWQRVDEAPVRRTQQGTLYKRDRDRLEDDPVLAGPIADALEPLPDMAALWLTLARAVGLLRDEPENDRIVAAGPDFWWENAFHLPQMIATRWLGLRSWHEQGGMQQEGSTVELALPYVRPAVLLWLATLPEDGWVAVPALDALLRGLLADWDRPGFVEAAPEAEPARGRGGRPRREEPRADPGAGSGVLESLLLGPAYQLGLVRAAEDETSGEALVQLSPLGRYILALGPPPPPRPVFDQFLYVQPNFEIIAYRQGLTPALIGQFSRFARWSQVGAALELKLTPESVYRGLEGGLTPQEMLERLSKHSQRALPAGVAEAVRTWAGRRERVTYYAAATLIEFATPDDLERALSQWPEPARGTPPIAVSDRLLLVEDDASIPFQRFRLTGSRDYRRAPEACLEIEPDGVTLSLDLGRSDLLVDAELARFADELPLEPARGTPGNPRRRFHVSSASLARALENGLTLSSLSHWFDRRAGTDLPPAVRLLLHASQPRVAPLETSRLLVIQAPTAEILDGLLQHPDTAPHLGERLGPTTVVVHDETLEPLRAALRTLGLGLLDPDAAGGGLRRAGRG
jgi:hypothetical protein